VNAGCDDSGRPLPFDPTSVLQCINALPFTVDGRYWDSGEGHVTCCWVDQEIPLSRLRLGNIRRSGLPQLEQDGTISPLSIPATSGLVEQVHVVFFPNQIVGSEFNFYGPRISRLGHYFAAKAKGLCPPLRFEPLLRQDVAEQLNRFQDIRLLQLKIRASYADILAQADEDLGNAFKAAARAGGAEELEIILKPPAYSRGRLSDRLLSAVKHLVRREDLRSEVSRFVVKGLNTATEQVDLVDVLSDLLIAKKQVSLLEDNRSRALNPMSAYNAIEEAYSELKDRLSVAAGVDR
jgi:hypothetical protein